MIDAEDVQQRYRSRSGQAIAKITDQNARRWLAPSISADHRSLRDFPEEAA